MEVNNQPITSAIVKGLLVSIILIILHVAADHVQTFDARNEILTVVSDQGSPSHDDRETTLEIGSYTITSALHLEIIREMVCLLRIDFDCHRDVKISVPEIPRSPGKLFRILFSPVISPNAP